MHIRAALRRDSVWGKVPIGVNGRKAMIREGKKAAMWVSVLWLAWVAWAWR